MPVYEYTCGECGRRSSILFRCLSSVEEAPRCRHCGAAALTRVPSRPALIRGAAPQEGGDLRAVDPRRAVEGLSRQYDRAGIDPGRGFEAVADRAARGDSPETLKEMVAEIRKSEGGDQP
jgi:putative FmdB family regulatory protein